MSGINVYGKIFNRKKKGQRSNYENEISRVMSHGLVSASQPPISRDCITR